MYLLTARGFLYLFDMETSTCLFNELVTRQPVMSCAPHPVAGQLLFVNDQGQVCVSMCVNMCVGFILWSNYMEIQRSNISVHDSAGMCSSMISFFIIFIIIVFCNYLPLFAFRR